MVRQACGWPIARQHVRSEPGLPVPDTLEPIAIGCVRRDDREDSAVQRSATVASARIGRHPTHFATYRPTGHEALPMALTGDGRRDEVNRTGFAGGSDGT
jgi:hypothetical protein